MYLFWLALASNVTLGNTVYKPPNPPILPADPPLELRGQSDVVLSGPHIVLTKTVGLDQEICASTNAITVSAGTEVYYCYFVTNIGDVDFGLHNVGDDKLGELQRAAAFELTAADGTQPAALFIVAEQITQTTENLATWTAYVADGPSATSSDTALVNVPAIVVTKTVSLTPDECWESSMLTVTAGTVVYYCYSVENSGNIPVELHTIQDEDLGDLWREQAFPLVPNQIVRSLDSEQIFSQTVEEDATGQVVWTATTRDGAQAKAETQAVVRVPTISVFKTVGTDPASCATETEVSVSLGQQVIYCYTVENTGHVLLTDHDVWDSQFGTLLEDAQFNLSPGAIGLFTITSEITGSISASVTWAASATTVIPGTATVPDSRTVSVTAASQAQTTVKLASLASFTAIIFRDINGNGIQDAEEQGLSGAVVTLEQSATKGNKKIALETAEEGIALFDGLAPGMYTGTVEFGTPLGTTQLTTANSPFNVQLMSGEKVQSVFGYKLPYFVLLPIARK